MEMLIEWLLPMTGAYIWLFRWARSTDQTLEALLKSVWTICVQIGFLFSLAYLWVRFSFWAHLG
jgi:hypothetical protein